MMPCAPDCLTWREAAAVYGRGVIALVTRFKMRCPGEDVRLVRLSRGVFWPQLPGTGVASMFSTSRTHKAI